MKNIIPDEDKGDRSEWEKHANWEKYLNLTHKPQNKIHTHNNTHISSACLAMNAVCRFSWKEPSPLQTSINEQSFWLHGAPACAERERENDTAELTNLWRLLFLLNRHVCSCSSLAYRNRTVKNKSSLKSDQITALTTARD